MVNHDLSLSKRAIYFIISAIIILFSFELLTSTALSIEEIGVLK